MRKIHTGLPGLMVRTLTAITLVDMNDFDFDNEKQGQIWSEIEKKNKFRKKIEKALKEVGDKIDANAKAGVEADLNALKSLLDSTKDQELSESQVADIKAAQEKLMQSAQALFAKVYEQAQAAGQAGPGPDMGGAANAGSAPDDDIIDGDFREV